MRIIGSLEHRPGIYAITHHASGKQYVGSSQDVQHRQYAHTSDLRLHRHGSIKLQRAYDKYGTDAFTFAALGRVRKVW